MTWGSGPVIVIGICVRLGILNANDLPLSGGSNEAIPITYRDARTG